MDGYKISLIFFLLFATPLAASINFDASVSPNATFSAQKFQYDSQIDTLETANVSIINTGSIGCTVQLRAAYNNSEEAFSRSVALWPGESTFLEVNKLFREEGLYQGVLQLDYCGQRKQVERFNFTAEGFEGNLSEMNSTTLEAGNQKAEVSLPVEEGLLVPESKPHYWKVSSAEIVNGSASVDLSAPIFDSEESISFAVYNESSGSIQALTDVKMESEVQKGYWEKRISALKDSSLEFLLISVFLNLVLAVLLVRSSPPDIESFKDSVFRD